jgi:hypothetical protein
LGGLAAPASATTLLYEPFDYTPVGTELSTADGSGGWLKADTSPSTLEPTIGSGSLNYAAGLPWTPTGNSVAMTGGSANIQAMSTRLIPGAPFESADAPTLYYSLLLNVSNVAGTAGSAGSFIAGFRNNSNTTLLAGAEAGAPLLIRQTATGSGLFHLGTGITQETGDRVFDSTVSYGANQTLLLVLSYQFVDNGDDIAKLYVNPDPALDEATNAAAGKLRVTALPTVETRRGIRDGLITNFFLRNNGSAPDNSSIDEVHIADSWESLWSNTIAGVWLGGTGNWSDSTMWSGGVVPSTATTPAQIDAGKSGVASVVTLDQDVAVRSVTVDPGDSFNIPAGRALTLSAPLGVGGIVNSSGNVEVLNASGSPTENGLTIAGGELRYDAGSIKPNGTVALSNGGKLLMAAGRDKVLKATNLTISSTSRVDLSDNFLILTNGTAGTFNGTVYNGLQGEIARAYNFGAWDLPGLMTSQENAGPNAGPLSGTTTIAVATAADILFIAATDTGIFAGETVTGASILAMYTYAGDLNFDGLVDAADYGVIDNWVQFPGTDGYMNGDLNYDGVIDAGDYGIIDNTIQLQGAPMPPPGSAAAAAVVAVPEPDGLLSVAAAAAAGLLSKRRRRAPR